MIPLTSRSSLAYGSVPWHSVNENRVAYLKDSFLYINPDSLSILALARISDEPQLEVDSDLLTSLLGKLPSAAVRRN